MGIKVIASGKMTYNEYVAVHKWINRMLGKPEYCNFEDERGRRSNGRL